MKKWSYLLVGILIGAIIATSGSAAAAQIKSLVGQKVSGELNVVINGQKLQDKGAVIGGRTNAPVRAISDAIGGVLTLNGDTIYITTDSGNADQSKTESSNKYLDMSKERLDEKKKDLENQIKILNSGKQELLDLIEKTQETNSSTTDINLIKSGTEKIEKINNEIKTLFDPELEKCQQDLKLVEEALSKLEE
ncbi:hypothetical protein [Paenibacillus aceti]|uniref:Copper amine oxidase-like N-terminal domain-containing protein n=1 Tax=Paenibacillus aceti TaxID=1820010 RepID=A0ABQ1VPI5_9BACL|nr:hypothetical protein [Paenibacillus aceti]GGF86994.1 hypothetical protein GCM10010913_05590 [Paenibacillus aceti]